MRSRIHILLALYQVAAGLSDTLTGILLLVAPLWTLHLMHITRAPVPAVFASYIGAFVLGVGLTYLWVAVRQWRGLRTHAEWESQWQCTAIIRACIAIFLTIEIASSRMELAWGIVAVSDGALALIQWIGLHRGWLRSANRNTVG